MKNLIFASLLLLGTSTIAQSKIDYNLDDGYVAGGYDVVAYFSNTAIEGKKEFVATHDGVKFKFSTAANKKTFLSNPEKYTPQYGGWCAYAMGLKEDKVDVDPETFEIRNGKLNLFYNSWGYNTLKKWLAEGPTKLTKNADANWAKIKYKK